MLKAAPCVNSTPPRTKVRLSRSIVLSPTGDQVGFVPIEKLASLHNFALRTGGMCNPGALQNNLDFSIAEMKHLFANGKVCGDERDLEGGKNLGVIRISFGASSTVEDVCAFVDFIRGVCEHDGIKVDE